MEKLKILNVTKTTYNASVCDANSCAGGGSCQKCGGGHCGKCGGGKCAGYSNDEKEHK